MRAQCFVLQRQKVPSKLINWPNENHWIPNPEDSRFFYSQVRDWLAKWINGPSPTGMSAGG